MYAQTDENLRRFTLSTWTTEQGLPQSFITAIDQTPDGFLWIGTEGGLARFDGLNFRTSFPDEPAAIHGGINGITHDDLGRLWVATTRGLLCGEGGVFRLVPTPGPGPPRIDRIVRAHDGGLLVGMGSHIWKLDRAGQRFIAIPTGVEKLRSFTEDQNGVLWITDSAAVTEVEASGKITRFPLPEASLITAQRDGHIYAGDGHRLYRFDGRAFVQIPNAGTEEFVAMTIARDGALWMASGGLQGLSRKTAAGVQRLDMSDGLASNDTRLLYEDRDEAMWVGTIAGLQRLKREAFVRYTTRDGLPPATAQYDAIFAGADHSTWTGTLEDGISVLRQGNWKTFNIKYGVRRGQIRGFVDDDKGSMPLVAIADYGLFRWSGHRYKKLTGIPPGYITSPIRTADGSIWFSIVRQGVFRLRDWKLEHFEAAQGLSEPVVWCLLADNHGGVWAGTTTGLFHFMDGRWTRVHPELREMIPTLAFSSSGELLVGTTTGIAIVRDNVVTMVGRAQGLMTDTVLQMVEDKDRSLWIVAATGINRVTRQQLDSVLTGRSATLAPQLFTEHDGLPGREFLPVSHVLGLRADDGRLWFTTTRGPTSGNALPEAAPRAILDGVTVDGISQLHDALQVRPGRHRITFNFTAPAFTAPEQLRFRYRMLGWDNAWIDAGRLREATYAGLPPGHYSFEVQAIGRGGVDGPLATISAVDLQPFFWQTRAFLVLAVIAMAALIIEFTRRRTLLLARRLSRQFQERAAERERIAYQIHDTVIQDLIGATLYLEIAEMQLATGDVDPDRPLEGLAARLRGTIARSRSMVANLHSTAIPEYGLLDVLRLAEAEFRLAVEPVFGVSYTGEPREVDPLLRDEVYRICREAIANAFRHANAKRVDVRVHFEPYALAIEIADDGVGMDDALKQRGRAGHFGLPAMHAHTKRIGALLTIDSAPECGTRISLVVRSSWWHRVSSIVRSRASGMSSRLVPYLRLRKGTR
jgi:ligand-binding sensor domain-containing protein/signal transduction histidine kinase